MRYSWYAMTVRLVVNGKNGDWKSQIKRPYLKYLMHLTHGQAGWNDVAMSKTGCRGEKERESWTDMEGKGVKDAKHTAFTFTVWQAALLWQGLMRATVQMHRLTWANWEWLKSVSACSATLVQLLPPALALPYCLASLYLSLWGKNRQTWGKPMAD